MINFEKLISKSDQFILKSDVVRTETNSVVQRLYDAEYSRQIIVNYWNKRQLQPFIVEDLSEFYNLETGATFWIYIDPENNKTLLTELDHTKLLLMMQISEVEDRG